MLFLSGFLILASTSKRHVPKASVVVVDIDVVVVDVVSLVEVLLAEIVNKNYKILVRFKLSILVRKPSICQPLLG